ncbi:P-loop containing nucleoside triphosphate hydrolase protein [Scleroderma yunnanense]
MTSETVIAVMGPTGSGKSNFINKLTGMPRDDAANDLMSCTKDLEEFRVSTSSGTYVFVDTPGFDDTCRSDREILEMIAHWLEEKYRGNIKLSGLIYTHCIMETRMSSSICKNLDMFGRLCGDKAAQRVRLVTTMWDSMTPTDRNNAGGKASQLEQKFWKPLIKSGARHRRFNNTQQSAWEIINDVTGDSVVLLLQEELVDAKRKLNETTAGRALYSQQERLLQKQKVTIKQLSDEAKVQQDPALARELEAEYKNTEAQLQKTWEEMEKLKVPFMRRIMLVFSKKPRTHAIQMNLQT